jgi:hypothetical protein
VEVGAAFPSYFALVEIACLLVALLYGLSEAWPSEALGDTNVLSLFEQESVSTPEFMTSTPAAIQH